MLLGGFVPGLYAQTKKTDSINAVIRQAKNDTTIAYSYVALTEQFFASKPDTVIPLCNKALAIIDKNSGKANTAEKRSYLFSKAAAINNIGYVYYVKGDIKNAITYFEQSLLINEEIGSQREIANALSNLGAIYDQQGEPGKALDYLNKAFAIQKEINAKEGMAYSLNNIAAIYDRQGQLEKTLEIVHQSLKLQEGQNNKHGIATCLNNLGALYVKLNQYDKALDYYNRSLKIRKEINDRLGIATCLHNIGYVYEKRNDRNKALDYDVDGMKIYEEIGDKRGVANSLHNIAAIYEKNGKAAEAMGFYKRAVSIYDSLGDKRGISNSLNNIAMALVASHQPKEAKGYALKALAAGEQGGYAEPIRTAHFALAKIDSALGNGAGALEHYKTYVRFRDSIYNEQTRKAALKKQFAYDYEKKEEAMKREEEKRSALQQEELKTQRLTKWSVAGGSILLLAVSVLLFSRHNLRQKNKFQQELNQQQKEQAGAVMETQEMERKRIAEDLHDSLGHLLSTAKLNLQTMKGSEEQVSNSLHLLNQASEEIRNITFNLMPRTLEEGGLVPALDELASRVNVPGVLKVSLHIHDIEKFKLEKPSQFNIYRIIQEAVNNIVKHANASEISIQLIGQSDHITIMIEDDGKGFTPGENKTGRGLKNIVTRSLWLRGNLNIDSTPGKGTTITTEIPV